MPNRNYNYDDFATKLLDFISSLTIKNKIRADLEETADSAKNGLRYTMAVDKSDSIKTYTWTREELQKALVPEDQINNYLSSRNTNCINSEYYNSILENKRKEIIDTYEEENDYYRMLNGLPDINDEPVMSSLGYVTELDSNQLYQLESSGELDLLIKSNIGKEYLRHLGSNKVSIYEARKANAFYILNYKKYILTEEEVKIFTELYYQSYVYITSVLYNNAFKDYIYYENFMILTTVFMTIQKYISTQYIESIKKDFYDIDSIRNTFLSYGLPFFEEIPVRYQRNIVKNINQLLQYKGTDKVLVDIVKLFGFSNTELFKYYLIKDIKRDDYGEPIIDYENPKNSFELKFAQVPLSDNDITQALRDTTLYQSYEDVVGDDPFWGDKDGESDFKDEILGMEFNYINTKYISMNTVFDVTKVNLETCHFFNTINTLYGKGCLDTISFISNNLKSSGNEISLFNVITALNSLIYKRFGYEDIIHKTSTSIASIYSFNFNTDLDELYDIIKENSRVNINNMDIDFDINKLEESDIRDLSLSGEQITREQLLELFFNNIDYKNYLITRMNECTNYQEFKALESIFNYNMVSSSMNDLYGDYETYSDYLKDNDYELYKFIIDNAIDNESTLKTIDTLLYSIESFLNSSRFDDVFSSLSNQTGNLVKKYILKIINLFKAYTVDLQKINFYFVMEDEVWGRIRMFSFICKYTNMNRADSLSDYLDCIDKVINIGKDIEKSKFKDNLKQEEFMHLCVMLDITNKVRDYLFDKIKAKFNVDYVFCENNALNDSNININSDVNNFINKVKVFERDSLFNNCEYILINAKLGGGIFDDNYDTIVDDNYDYLYPNEHFE